MAEVLKILNNYQPEWTPPSASGSTPPPTGNSGTGNSAPNNRPSISFLQSNGNQQVNYLRVTCRACSLKGHYQSHCPVANSSGNRFGTGTTDSTSNDSTTSGSRTTESTTATESQDAAAQEVSSLRNSGILLNKILMLTLTHDGYSWTVSQRTILFVTKTF